MYLYGEFNFVVFLNLGVVFVGLNGWCYGGWIVFVLGSYYFFEVKGGVVIVLFFLLVGCIIYDVKLFVY